MTFGLDPYVFYALAGFTTVVCMLLLFTLFRMFDSVSRISQKVAERTSDIPATPNQQHSTSDDQ
ncbi:hypothetical protein [Rhodospira trueperi]|uniref:Heme exporter protein D n=1 Tax=Rhodospira trueperi TaxID=69960 RepID=A0A1G6X8V7_9PROT|nr:hypothetical protein [Rhodospira trueperi]SDD74619.1 hypothetical protein SAMN05421720_101412 [Rhodospira trueperi]